MTQQLLQFLSSVWTPVSWSCCSHRKQNKTSFTKHPCMALNAFKGNLEDREDADASRKQPCLPRSLNRRIMLLFGWGVRGERWEARGRVWCCRGGACLWMMALSLIRAPAAPDAHTHMLTFMRKHTLRINLLNLRPPELQSLLSVFNKDFFPVWCQHYSLFFHAGASCLCQICPAVTVWHLPSPLHPLWCLTDCSIQPLVSVWLMMQLWTTTALELKLIRAVERHSVKQQRVLKGCER